MAEGRKALLGLGRRENEANQASLSAHFTKGKRSDLSEISPKKGKKRGECIVQSAETHEMKR